MQKIMSMNLGARIKEAMRLAGVKQEAMARHLDLKAYETVSRWWRGKRNPNKFQMRGIAEFCKVDFDWLRTGDGEPRPASDQVAAPEPKPNTIDDVILMSAKQRIFRRGRPGKKLLSTPNVKSDYENALRELTDKYRVVPVYDTAAGWDMVFGDGDLPSGQSMHDPVPTSCKHPHCAGARVNGDSMQPEFMHGEIIIVDPGATVKHKDYVVFRLQDGRTGFKQVYFDPGDMVRFHPLNSEYADIVVQKKDVRGMVRVHEKIQRY